MKASLRSAGQVIGSIQLTLVLSIVVPLLVISGLAIYLGVGTVEKALNDRLQEDLELVARAARGPLSRAMQENDELVIGDSLKSIFRIGRVSGASVFDKDGARIASLGLADTDVGNSASAEQVINSGELGGAFRWVDGQSVFSHFTPLVADDGRIQGLLQITRRRSDFHELLASSRLWAVSIWSALAVTIILVVVLGHYGAVGRHVSKLLNNMAALAPGHWRLDAEPSGPRELRQIYGGVRDMGERMARAEEEIQQRVARERELAERLEYQEKIAMIGRVAGGVAHELGAPLNVIQGRADILARHELTSEQRRQLDDIGYQVGRMTTIIRQLLDCFRHVPDSRRPVCLNTVLEDVLDRAREDEKCRGRRLLSQGLDVSACVKAEPVRLELACLNVVRNACQAAGSEVVLSLHRKSGEWEVRVDDDGPGIAVEKREAVFEPFYSTRAAGEGTGLGLAVVSSVLKEHGGRVEVGSNKTGGCRISLFWPAETIT
ncbi:ATP-binding protein [Marinobacter sp. F3R11]|uniref:ATP-binding protein n=1 Tax=Marinobacter sp. F3R11 TaxID=2267231 RepID=UPI000DEB8FCD|nr:ATP-binding protein [Marinobacter sp. F3R11]RBW48411.1 histidine kinase [Marinobacter sp. F3R11]